MACIVYTTDAAGRQYAYSSESHWNKEKKQSRSKRTYLGRVNPETGEIMKGRQNGKNYKPNRKNLDAAPDQSEVIQQLQQTLSERNVEILAMKQDIQALQSQVRRMSSAFQKIVQTANNAVS